MSGNKEIISENPKYEQIWFYRILYPCSLSCWSSAPGFIVWKIHNSFMQWSYPFCTKSYLHDVGVTILRKDSIFLSRGSQTNYCAEQVPSHYLNRCWVIVQLTLKNKLQWNSNQNAKLFIHENAFQNAVCEMASILSRVNELNMFSFKFSGYQWVPNNFWTRWRHLTCPMRSISWHFGLLRTPVCVLGTPCIICLVCFSPDITCHSCSNQPAMCET